ncbi:hypothetical protein POVWA2_032440 [Plasmodium ovale wallikeri]|uniref:Uncharacterized protein n=1 Tax=Plasmodium ovale wallikeri TaxID=864142 RepID=A0A1A8YZG2_PLAOA|nr:hypothetical protein POVWA1_032810 [Plasmodium ovale wallikeri]SBT36918.1 hypothetical protein POVWA2_032440 [Plasmodium ovale wallikeri]
MFNAGVIGAEAEKQRSGEAEKRRNAQKSAAVKWVTGLEVKRLGGGLGYYQSELCARETTLRKKIKCRFVRCVACESLLGSKPYSCETVMCSSGAMAKPCTYIHTYVLTFGGAKARKQVGTCVHKNANLRRSRLA